MTRALNIKIQDAIYSQLDQQAKSHNLTKTQIVEKALSQWFDNVDENVDNSVDDVDKDVDEDVGISRTDFSDSYQTDIEGLIHARIAEYLLGVTCPVPTVSEDVESNVDGDVDSVDKNVDGDVESNVDADVDSVDKNVDGDVESNVDGDVDSVDKNVDGDVESTDSTNDNTNHLKLNGIDDDTNQNSSEPVTQKYLSQRMGISSPTIAKYLKNGSVEEANQFCEKHDPDGCYWQWSSEDKRYYLQFQPLTSGY